MNEYKSIREWIAEGVNPVGYVSRTGMPLVRCDIRDAGLVAFFDCGGEEQESDLEHHVAPPKPKRLSDEELLDKYGVVSGRLWYDCEKTEPYEKTTEKHRDLHTQILDRMKAKGPTRREVENFLDELGNAPNRSDAYEAFISMFPEAEE